MFVLALPLLFASALSDGRIFAPYIDVTGPNSFDPTNALAAGVSSFMFAFAQASCTTDMVPVWGPGGGNPSPINSQLTKIKQIQAANGKVIVSFGGVAQTTSILLPAQCAVRLGKNASELQAFYQVILDTLKVNRLDFDIEGAPLDDIPSITLRNAALAGLKAANPTLVISYTLPVTETGLLANSTALLNNAKTNGAVVDIVNVMAMDYGSPIADMGTTAIQAANGTFNQVQSIFPTVQIGITPMIGKNDVPGEVFSLTDATTVATAAKALPFVSFLSMWQLSVDTDFSFSKAFLPFTSSVDNGKIASTTTSAAETTTSSVASSTPTSSAEASSTAASSITSTVQPSSTVTPADQSSTTQPVVTITTLRPPPPPPTTTSQSVVITQLPPSSIVSSVTATVDTTSASSLPTTVIGLLGNGPFQAAATLSQSSNSAQSLQSTDGTTSAPIFTSPDSSKSPDAAAVTVGGTESSPSNSDTPSSSNGELSGPSSNDPNYTGTPGQNRQGNPAALSSANVPFVSVLSTLVLCLAVSFTC